MKTSFSKGKELLIRGAVDVILIPTVVTTSDVGEFDYSFPVVKTWYEIYIKRNGNGATWASYIETWSPSLWAAFLSTILILSTALWIMATMRERYNLKGGNHLSATKSNLLPKYHKRLGIQFTTDQKRQASSSINKERNSMSYCFLTVLRIITNQGFTLTEQSTSLRIIMLVVLFFGLLMLNSYSAVLVSRLAVDKVDILFPTLESIIDRNKYSLCVRQNSYAYRIFKKNENDAEVLPSWRPIVNRSPCENVTTVNDIADALCTDHTIVLESPYVISSFIESCKCVITRMPGRYAVAYTSLLMRNNFQFKKQINDILQKLSASGILDFLQKKWLNRRIAQSINISNNKPVTIDHINGILVIYAATIISSLILLFTRKFFGLKNKNREIRIPFAN